MTPSIMSTAMSLGTLWAFMIFALFGIAWKFKEEEARKGEQTGLVHPRF